MTKSKITAATLTEPTSQARSPPPAARPKLITGAPASASALQPAR